MVLHRKRRRRARRRGAAVVEAAIVLPILILLVLGVSELSWCIHCAHALNNAARQGARAAVYHENSNAEVVTAVRTSVANALDLDPSAVSVGIAALNSSGAEEYQVQNLNENEQGKAVRVSVTVDYAGVGFATDMLGFKNGQLASYAVMRRRK